MNIKKKAFLVEVFFNLKLLIVELNFDWERERILMGSNKKKKN